MDAYLLYASVALVVLGVGALGLFFVFRRRFSRLTIVSRGSVANVFNRTFVVFDPYSRKAIIHRFLSLLPFVPLVLGWSMAVLVLVIINAGLLLTLLVSIVGLSLIVIEESVEALDESKLLIRAIEGGSSFGVGDVRLLTLTKRLLPRLSRYYLGLSVCFFVLAGVLPFVWEQFMLGLGLFLGSLVLASAVLGPIGWLLGLGLYAGALTVLFFLVTVAKSRIFGGRVEAESSELRV